MTRHTVTSALRASDGRTPTTDVAEAVAAP
jgi:hypothetical protein